MRRRRPVPRAWRDEHHSISVSSRYHSGGAIRGSVVYRAGGVCSCGEKFGKAADRHNMDRWDVLEAWRDHVEHAYYAERAGA